jgi:hypothetical protein
MRNLPGAIAISALLCGIAALGIRGAILVLKSDRYVHPSGYEFTGVRLKLYAGALIALSLTGVGVSALLIRLALRE